jgi:hypothetical protein
MIADRLMEESAQFKEDILPVTLGSVTGSRE